MAISFRPKMAKFALFLILPAIKSIDCIGQKIDHQSLGTDQVIHNDIIYYEGSKDECRYSENIPFKEEDKDFLYITYGVFKVNIKRFKEEGYYLWQERDERYGTLLKKSQEADGDFAVIDKVLPDYNFTATKITLSNDSSYKYVCGYQNPSPNFTTCANFNKICAADRVNITKPCYYYSKFELGFCKQLISNTSDDQIPEECRSCDDIVERYPEPSIHLQSVQLKMKNESLKFLEVVTKNYAKLLCFDSITDKRIFCFSDAQLKNGSEIQSRLSSYSRVTGNYGNNTMRWYYEIPADSIGHYWCEGFNWTNHQIRSDSIIIASDTFNPLRSVTMNITINSNQFQPDPVPFELPRIIYEDITGHIRNYEINFLHVYPKSEGIAKLSYRIYSNHSDISIREFYEEIRTSFESEGFVVKDHSYSGYDLNTISLSTPFCQPESTELNGTVLNWPKTELGTTVLSVEPCFDDFGIPVTRTCLGEYIYGVYWSSIAGSCIVDISEMPDSTRKLLELANTVVEDVDSELASLHKIMDEMSISGGTEPVDVHYIAEILESVVHANGNVTKFLEITSDVMNLDKTALRNAQLLLNSTDRFLDYLVKYFQNDQIGENEIVLKTENIYVYSNLLSMANGAALYDSGRLEVLKDINNPAQIDQKKLLAAVFVPPKFILKLKESVSSYRITAVFFRSNSFFNQEEDYNSNGVFIGLHVSSLNNNDYDWSTYEIVTITKPDVAKRNNMKTRDCGVWNYGINPDLVKFKGFWITQNHQDENARTCVYKRSGYFGLLGDSSFLDNQPALVLITYVGCAISVLSSIGIIFLAVIHKTWREQSGTKVLISFVLALIFHNVSVLVVTTVDLTENDIVCAFSGAVLHYSVLVQLVWALLFGYLQYRRFVVVFADDRECVVCKLSLIAWGCPLIPPFITLAIDPNYYRHEDYCYLTDFPLIIGVYIPIIAIIIVNVGFFVTIMKSLPKSELDNEICYLIFKLTILMFFVFGFYWIFALVAVLTHTLDFVYIFTIAASLHSLVVFLYYVAFNAMLKNFLIRFAHNFKLNRRE